jgi:hypothetical protein
MLAQSCQKNVLPQIIRLPPVLGIGAFDLLIQCRDSGWKETNEAQLLSFLHREGGPLYLDTWYGKNVKRSVGNNVKESSFSPQKMTEP